MGYSFQLAGQVRSECLTCTFRANCYSACLSWAQVPAITGSYVRDRIFQLAARVLAQWVHHEGLIQWPIATWANAFITELHLAPKFIEMQPTLIMLDSEVEKLESDLIFTCILKTTLLTIITVKVLAIAVKAWRGKQNWMRFNFILCMTFSRELFYDGSYTSHYGTYWELIWMNLL